MILDKKLNGILDQGVGCLELFETQATDPTYVLQRHTRPLCALDDGG